MAFYIKRNELPLPGAAPKVRMRIDRPLDRRISAASDMPAQAPCRPGDKVRDGSFASALKEEREKSSLPRTADQWVEYTIKQKDTLWGLAVRKFHVNVEDLIRDNGIRDPLRIQPGQKIRVRLPSYPGPMKVVASWYGREHHGRAMANGEIFDMNAATIAHKELPLGTRVELENPSTGQRAKAVVADRGPYVAGRDVELSYALARKLSLLEKGVGRLVMRVLG